MVSTFINYTIMGPLISIDHYAGMNTPILNCSKIDPLSGVPKASQVVGAKPWLGVEHGFISIGQPRLTRGTPIFGNTKL
jgi:hypothetical protein